MTPEQRAMIDELHQAGLLWSQERLNAVAAAMGQVLADEQASKIAAAAAIGLLLENVIGQIEPIELRLDFVEDWIRALRDAVRGATN